MTNYILCVGDSITLGSEGPVTVVTGGYRRTLELRLETVGYEYTALGPSTANSAGLDHPEHAGYAGYRIDEVSPIVLAMSSTPAPTYILLDIGTNDLSQSYLLGGINTRLDNFINDMLAKWPTAQIIVTTVGPFTGIYAGIDPTSYNSHILGLSITNVTSIDNGSQLTTDLLADGVHYTTDGYIRMGDLWYTALKAKGIFTVSDSKITALGSLAAQPASGDLLPLVDISDTTQAASGSTKKIAAAYFAQTQGTVATITGGGTIALGGFTLTVPATGTAALLATGNTFTVLQTFAPASTSVDAINVNMPSSTSGYVLYAKYNGVLRHYMQATATASVSAVQAADLGNGSYGPHITIGNNTNATGPGAGFVYMIAKGNTGYSVWPDNSGNLRIWADVVNGANDTSGTVVGTQTSMAAAKNISDALPNPTDALLGVWRAAKEGLRAWSYKSGSYNGEFFPNGIVTDLAPRYGMDRDAEHPAGKSLNIPVAIGDLMAAVAVIMEKLGIQTEEDLKSWLH